LHEEGLVYGTFGNGYITVNSVHQFEDGAAPLAFRFAAATFEGFEGADTDDGNIIAGNIHIAQELAEFNFNEFEEFTGHPFMSTLFRESTM
jgi:hypothetical protein